MAEHPSDPNLPKVTIHILRGKAARKSREMKGPTLLVGSESTCDVQMRSQEVGGKHCLISRRGPRVIVTELDPQFPVYLNGASVHEAEIVHGDKLTIGPFELSVSLENADGSIFQMPRNTPRAADPVERPAAASKVPPTPGAMAGPAGAERGPGSRLFDFAQQMRKDPPQSPYSRSRNLEAAQAQEAEAEESTSFLPDEQPAAAPVAAAAPKEKPAPGPLTAAPAVQTTAASAAQTTAASAAHQAPSYIADEPYGSHAGAMPSYSTTAPEPMPNTALNPPVPPAPAHVPVIGPKVQQDTRVQQGWLELEAERKELLRQKERLREQKESLDRDMREQAMREQDIVEANNRIKRAETELQRAEHELEQQRLVLTEDGLELDRTKQSFEQKTQKFHRIRRQLFDQYRARQKKVDELVQVNEKKSFEVENGSRELDREVHHWKQVAEELAKKQTELNHRASEFDERLEQLKRDEKDILTRRGALEQDAQNLRLKERALENLRSDLEQRKARIADEEITLRSSRDSLELEFKQMRDRSAEVQSRYEEVEGKARILEKQEQHLKERARSIETQRLAQTDRDRELAARQAEMEELEASHRSREENLRRRTEELNIHENQLVEQARLLHRKEEELARREQQNELRDHDLERRTSELEQHANAIVEEFEVRRKQIEQSRQQFDVDRLNLEQEKQRFSLQRDQWLARVNEVREYFVELSQRASIQRVRETQMESLQQYLSAEKVRIQEQSTALAIEIESVQEQRAQAERIEVENADRSDRIRSDSERLESLAHSLEMRQQEVVERERNWCEEVKRRKAELETLQTELDKRRNTLDREMTAHRRHVKKLREVSLKVVQRRRQSHDEVHFLKSQQNYYEQQLRGLAEQHERLRGVVEHFLDVDQHSDAPVSAWDETIRFESEMISETQGTVRDQIDGLVKLEGNDPQTVHHRQLQLRSLERTLKDYADRLAQLQSTITKRDNVVEAQRRRVLDSRQRLEESVGRAPRTASLQSHAPLPEMMPETKSAAKPARANPTYTPNSASMTNSAGPTTASKLTLPPPLNRVANQSPAPTVSAVPSVAKQETPPTLEKAKPVEVQTVKVVTPVTSNLAISDAELMTRIEKGGICDRDTLQLIQQAAAGRRVSLVDQLLGDQVINRYQLDKLVEGDLGQLTLGSARVIDKIHSGTVATTYKVQLPGYERPMALRLLDPRWCRDENMRNSFVVATNALTSFRHSHVVALHELFILEEQYGVILDYFPSLSLAELTGQKIPAKAVVHFCQQATTALVAAQRAGFVHRNLRPSRLLVSKSADIRLLGYGEPAWLSKIQRCEKGKVCNTYLSPEEMSAHGGVDVRSDLYSLGRIMIELATGAKPSEMPGEVALSSEYPKEFAKLLTELTREDPYKRIASASDALSRLDDILVHPNMHGDPWPELAGLFDRKGDLTPKATQAPSKRAA